MLDPVPAEILEALRDRVHAAGMPGPDGRRLELRPARLIIGRVCDDDPLLCTEAALARYAPERLLRGLAVAGMLCGAEELALAVDEEQPELLATLRRAATGSRVEILPVAPRVPLDADCLLADLAERGPRPPAGLRGARVLDAVVLADLALAAEGRPVLQRVVTVSGLVERPSVLLCAVGTPLGELVRSAGGSADPAAFLLHNGALGEPATLEQPVELDTRGVVVLPHDHPLVARRSVPVSDELRRAGSACASCRVCTEICTAHLLGARLEPDLVLRAAAASFRPSTAAHDAALLGALECRGCGLCSVSCPAGLRPATVVAAIAARLRQQGVEVVEPAPLRPHPERAGRRLSRRRLQERLGLGGFAAPEPRLGATVVPGELRVSARGPSGEPRVPVVRAGEPVATGDLLALAPAGSDELDCLAPAAGRVLSVDPDDGIAVALC